MTPRLPNIAFVIAMTSLSASAAELAIDARLPELRAEDLSGRKAMLPNDASGRVALLMFGFTYKSRFAVEAWASRFREEFDSDPQVTFFEIPMIGGLARLGKWFIDSGMRRGTPKSDREHVITVYGDTKVWKGRVGYQAGEFAYLVLLDRKGTVAWRHAGLFEESQFKTLKARVHALVDEP